MQAIRSRIPDIPESNVRDARKERDEEYISIANNRICPYYHASQGEKKFHDDAKYTRYTSRKGRHPIKENY